MAGEYNHPITSLEIIGERNDHSVPITVASLETDV